MIAGRSGSPAAWALETGSGLAVASESAALGSTRVMRASLGTTPPGVSMRTWTPSAPGEVSRGSVPLRGARPAASSVPASGPWSTATSSDDQAPQAPFSRTRTCTTVPSGAAPSQSTPTRLKGAVAVSAVTTAGASGRGAAGRAGAGLVVDDGGARARRCRSGGGSRDDRRGGRAAQTHGVEAGERDLGDGRRDRADLRDRAGDHRQDHHRGGDDHGREACHEPAVSHEVLQGVGQARRRLGVTPVPSPIGAWEAGLDHSGHTRHTPARTVTSERGRPARGRLAPPHGPTETGHGE